MASGWRTPHGLQAEIAAIAALARNADGPIADTYERLQGVPFLRAARPASGVGSPETRMFIGLYQCRTLAHLNISYLVARARAACCDQEDNLGLASHDMRWASAIVRIAVDIATSLERLLPSVPNSLQTATPSAAPIDSYQGVIALEEALHAAHQRSSNPTKRAIEYQYLLDGMSVIIHEVKSLRHLLLIEAGRHIPAINPNLANDEILKMATYALQTRRATYLMQFRLLHQMPEILAAEVVDLLDAAGECVLAQDFEVAADRMQLSNVALRHICDTLWPLINLMYPSEYYRIRAHLGQTSGSKSRDIGAKLINKTYKRLAATLEASPGARTHHRLLAEAVHLRSQLNTWRNLHILLPKNVLGRNTTSLIGSPDAVSAVQTRKTTFDRASTVRRSDEMLSSHHVTPETELGGASFLLEQTGIITRRRFPNVEDRTGLFAPKTRTSRE